MKKKRIANAKRGKTTAGEIRKKRMKRTWEKTLLLIGYKYCKLALIGWIFLAKESYANLI